MPQKNTRPFAGREGGLLALKLRQLSAVSRIDEVIVDSNDPEVLGLAEALRHLFGPEQRLTVRARPDHLGRSETTTDALIEYALSTVECEHLLWTHVTSPMVDGAVYDRAIQTFFERDVAYDSLMSVHRLQTFLWDGHGPINYDRAKQRWPRTQTLEPRFAVDSAIFLVPMNVGRAVTDRIGHRPKLFELTPLEAIDVDWEDDFNFAQTVYRAVHGDA